MRMLYHATSEARKAVLPYIDNWEKHWQRHERVFTCIRDHKPELASKAVLDDLQYAEKLLHKHVSSLEKYPMHTRNPEKRDALNVRVQPRKRRSKP